MSKQLTDLTSKTTPASADLLLIRDVSAGSDKKTTVGQLAASVLPTMLGVTADSSNVATSQNFAGTSFGDMGTVGPSVTVTVGVNGIAVVILTCNLANDTGTARSIAGYVVSGANTVAASDTQAIWSAQVSGATAPNQMSSVYLLKGLTAGSTTFKMQYRVTAGTGTFQNRYIAVLAL